MMLKETFGATSDDADALRIPSLVEMDSDALERMWARAPRPPAADPRPLAAGRLLAAPSALHHRRRARL
jgi:hypothetical protein